jgi:glycosyltransferase involved in cell wall biosynthesis
LRANGVDVEVVVWKPGHPFGFRADRELGRAGRALYGLAVPGRRDVLHFQYGTTWLPRAFDARWARLWGRTLVVGYHGDDCRLAAVVAREGWPLAELDVVRDDDAVAERMRRIAMLVDAAVVADFELVSYVREYFRRVYVIPHPVAPVEPPAPRLERATRIVLHAPSDPVVKGTELIAAAVQRVAARRPLEFRLLTGVPHAEVREALATADVLVDQLRSATASMLALEAMGHGVPVLSRVDPRAFASFHDGLPVVPVTPDSLERELEVLLDDPERRRELGERGRAYVAATHGAERVAAAMLRVYEHARSGPPGVYELTGTELEKRSD